MENRQTQAEGHLIKELIGSPQKCQGWDFPGDPVAELHAPSAGGPGSILIRKQIPTCCN